MEGRKSLILHGGAWDILDDQVEACKIGCRRALAEGWAILASGGSALDAVERAVVMLEDDPVFDAGYGSHLNRDGQVECDAIVIDGTTLRAGATAGLQRVKNPIRVARSILEHCPHMMLVATGAERFAVQQGLSLCDPADLISPFERDAFLLCSKKGHSAIHHCGRSHGTVGAVATDSEGRMFAATSTGGTCCKLPGRVGDSPLIGCGCYADVYAGAASCTGHGESIMKIVMAKTAVDLLREQEDGNSHDAAAATVRLLAERTGGTGGIILLDRFGNPSFSYNTRRMAYGYVRHDGEFVVGV